MILLDREAVGTRAGQGWEEGRRIRLVGSGMVTSSENANGWLVGRDLMHSDTEKLRVSRRTRRHSDLECIQEMNETSRTLLSYLRRSHTYVHYHAAVQACRLRYPRARYATSPNSYTS